MKVLQLIDSLQAGGTERMAVNMANGLSSLGEDAFLCATREEGLLKSSLSNTVGYLFLGKKSALDLKAITTLNRFVKVNGIEIIHAHSTSFFLGTLIKMLNPKLILIWHDHYGNSEFLEHRPKFILKWCSFFFNHVCTVNTKLEVWNKKVLNIKSASYLRNFVTQQTESPITTLKGIEGKRIVCLANLRPQKDHINLLNAFKIVENTQTDWTLHLVGHDFNDDYSKAIKTFIKENALEEHVFVYGSCVDINHILEQSAIGILASNSEGLPLSLLEYGLAGLPVIATDVGDCNQVISNPTEGKLIPSKDDKALAEALIIYMNDRKQRMEVANNLHLKVKSGFSEAHFMKSLLKIYKQHHK